MKNIKKKIKTISLVLMVCIVSTALSGCFSLQELKEKQANMDDEGNICVGNYKYIAIEAGEELNPDFDEFNEVYISDEEIPLLLTPEMGSSYTISDDGIFIEGYKGYYCREDKYEEVSSALSKKYTVKGYKYGYHNFEKDKLCDEEMSAESVQTIKTILSKVKGEKNGETLYDQYETSCTIYSYGESKYLTREEFAIEFCKDKIYFVKYIDDDGSIIVYDIPNNYHSQLREMFKPVLENS